MYRFDIIYNCTSDDMNIVTMSTDKDTVLERLHNYLDTANKKSVSINTYGKVHEIRFYLPSKSVYKFTIER